MRRWIAMAVLCGGCRDDVTDAQAGQDTEPPEFLSVCGERAPRELLSLAPGEHGYAMDWAPGRERMLVGIYRVDGPLGVFPDSSDRAIVGIDECGAQRADVAEGMEVVASYDGIALACTVDGDALYRIDPWGAQAPVLVLDGTCAVRRTDVGLVAVVRDASGTGSLVIVRDPAAESPTASLLLAGVGVPDNPFFGDGDARTTSLWAKGREAIAMTPTGDVIAFNLDDGTTELILDDALEFRASSDGRHLLWQIREPLEGDPDTPVSPVFVHDRETEQDVHLLNTHLAWTGAPFRDDWIVVRDDSALGLRVFTLQGAPQELPAGTSLRGILDDDQFWLARSGDGMIEELLWDRVNPPSVIIDHHRGHPAKSGDGIKVFVDGEGDRPLEGALFYGAFAGGEVEHWSARVNFYHRVLADGRLLGIVNEDANAHGELRLEDPQSGEIILVDPHGYLHSPSLNAGDPFDGDIVYAVDDPGAARHALFRARVQ